MIPDRKFVTNPTLQKMTHSIIPNLGPEIFDNTLFIFICFVNLQGYSTNNKTAATLRIHRTPPRAVPDSSYLSACVYGVLSRGRGGGVPI